MPFPTLTPEEQASGCDSSNEGSIRLFRSDDGDTMVVCVKRYNEYVWVPINSMSGANWMKYRGTFGEQMLASNLTAQTWAASRLARGAAATQHLQLSSQQNTASSTTFSSDDNAVNSLFSILTNKQKRKWLSKNPNFTKNMCKGCGYFCSEMKKCVHLNCQGMCSSCFDKINPFEFEVCGCCNQKQELDCPICMETHPVTNMLKSENCCHHVCYKCFGMSVQTSRPLSHCPMCRCVFCQNLVDEDDSSDDSDMSDISDVSDNEDDLNDVFDGNDDEYSVAIPPGVLEPISNSEDFLLMQQQALLQYSSSSNHSVGLRV
jgi:hypothetical protein